MSIHVAEVQWRKQPEEAFIDNRYSRRHEWRFDGGVRVPASSSPHAVRVPFSDPAAVDPEEAYVAALSSCHMLWFLSLAAQKKFVVMGYLDAAEGTMEKNAEGKEVVTRVVLKPHVTFGGERVPGDAEVEALHHAAHDACFLANSVRTAIEVEGRWACDAGGLGE
ncbi:OsmC family protein [Burkholderia alba]|uniref:OsmC family protein n=1 Tax=Burkholderia alba TaxID=2683677 RepID=UPI002B05C634|nr:OsmC family protein [Burkholderia alba]